MPSAEDAWFSFERTNSLSRYIIDSLREDVRDVFDIYADGVQFQLMLKGLALYQDKKDRRDYWRASTSHWLSVERGMLVRQYLIWWKNKPLSSEECGETGGMGTGRKVVLPFEEEEWVLFNIYHAYSGIEWHQERCDASVHAASVRFLSAWFEW